MQRRNARLPKDGYPAWAGIDPLALYEAEPIPRLPRVGGDRPFSGFAKLAEIGVTPRGRG